MNHKKPHRGDWEARRMLQEAFNFQADDFQSNGFLSERGIHKAEQWLESTISSDSQFSILFKIYSQSLKSRRPK